MSRLVNGHHQHPQLGPSATNPAALNIAAGAKSTPTTSSLMLVEALRAANLADNPTNLLVDRSQNGGQ